MGIEDGMIDSVHLKGLMVSKKDEKQNKLFSIKYQSYHRHHLIRISSCLRILQRAKRRLKKRIIKLKNVPLQLACIQFFWKVVLLPSRIVQCEKNAGDTMLKTNQRRETTTYFFLNNRRKKK